MSKPAKKGQRSEADAFLDEIGPEPEPEVDNRSAEVLTKDDDEKPAAEAKPAEVEAKPADETPAETEQPVETPTEPTEEQVQAAAEAEKQRGWEELERANHGLRNELSEIRRKYRESAAQARAPQAPAPYPPVADPTQVPVSEGPGMPQAGQINPQDLIKVENGSVGIDTQMLAKFVRQVNEPDPATVMYQERQAEEARLRDDFVRENPALNSKAYEQVEQALEFVMLSTQQKAADYGMAPHELGSFDGFMDFANRTGVLTEVSQRYPHLAEEIPNVIRASHLQSRHEMHDVLRRYSQRLGTVLGGGQATPAHGAAHAAPPAPQIPTVGPLAHTAPDLSKMGSSTPPGQAARGRLEALEARENADPISGLDVSELNELEKLRAKLNVYETG